MNRKYHETTHRGGGLRWTVYAKQLPVKLVLLSPLGKQVTLYLNKLEIRFYYIRMLCVNFGLH